jgi:hypothetical protein
MEGVRKEVRTQNRGSSPDNGFHETHSPLSDVHGFHGIRAPKPFSHIRDVWDWTDKDIFLVGFGSCSSHHSKYLGSNLLRAMGHVEHRAATMLNIAGASVSERGRRIRWVVAVPET